MPRHSLTFLTIPLALALGFAAGCGREQHASDATGIVTLDEQPLTSGTITFYPVDDGPMAYATIAPDGSFTIKTGSRTGLLPGDYVVTVVATDASAQTDPGQPVPLLTPKRYADHKESDLRINVPPGETLIEIPLTSE